MFKRRRHHGENAASRDSLGSVRSNATAAFIEDVFLHERDARLIVLARSLEQGSGIGVLSEDDRNQATAVAWEGVSETQSDSEWARTVLVARARQLVQLGAQRSRQIAFLAKAHDEFPVSLGLMLIAALVLGFLADHVPNPDRINLLAIPLFAIILWNWMSMLATVILPMAWRRNEPSGLVRWVLEGLSRLAIWKPIARRWDRSATSIFFWGHWIEIASPLLYVRLKYRLNLAAIAMVLGALVSLSIGAWQHEFKVGWASTLCRLDCAYVVHNSIFAPTTLIADLIGVTPFSRDELSALHHWMTADNGQGERWFRLTAALLVLTVAVPRLLFAIYFHWRARRLSASVRLRLNSEYFWHLRAPAKPEELARSEDATQSKNESKPRIRRWIDCCLFWRRRT